MNQKPFITGISKGMVELVQPTITNPVTSIDWGAGHIVINTPYDVSADTTAITSFSGIPRGGRTFLSILFKHNGGARKLTLPAVVKSTITLAGTSGNWDHIVLWTDDGGTNIYGQVVESK